MSDLSRTETSGTEPSRTEAEEVDVTAAPRGVYAPYGQLIKMLLPRCGGVSFYAPDRELLWCSDGYERPDLKVVLDDPRAGDDRGTSPRGGMRELGDDSAAFVYPLRGQAGEHRGTLIVELARGQHRRTSGSMVASLLQPVIDCLERHVDVESTLALAATRRTDASRALRMRSIIGADDAGGRRSEGLERLVRQCVKHFDCVLGALLIPDWNLAINATRDGGAVSGSDAVLTRTRKHLLAWLQLHDKALVINSVMADAAAKGIPPYKILSCPVRDPNGRVVGLFGLFRSPDGADFEPEDVGIVELMSRKAMGVLNDRYDDLTGLLNRSAFEHDAQLLLRGEGAEPAAGEATVAALLYVDIDALSVANSAFGYHAGDEIIQRLALVIKDNVGAEDLVGRLGSDRFVVLRPPGASAGPEALAEQLRAAMGELTYLHGERAVPVSVSIGIGRSAGPGQTIAHLIAAAEYACKRAKALGRNRIETSHADDAFAVARQDDAMAFASLESALKAGRFSLEIQSIESLDGEPRILGREVLTRMREGEDFVGPDRFLAAAERYHLMPALDRWMVAAALRNLSAAGVELLDHGWISLNVSAQSLLSDSFREFLIEQLTASGLPPASFCIELRESSAAHNLREAQALIRSLRDIGAKVALDDFGRGLSSLAYLRSLPVQYIKIDGGIVRRVASDRLAESLVVGISQAAAALGIESIAEHVETEEIAAKLREIGIRYGQGYHLSRPVPMPGAHEETLSARRSARGQAR